MKEILYIALVLDESSKNKLVHLANEITKDVDFTPKLFCHHSTLAFYTNLNDNILNYAYAHLGETFTIYANTLGISDKAVAVGVEYECPCANKNKHITLITNTNANGKPSDSNNIKIWQPINSIELKDKLTIYYKQ